MKKLHLICNAHLDPVWMWDWDDGMATALATFYSACELADEYDYIFCHNEVLLYEYIRELNPALFRRMQELAKEGKWHIMGGWFLQPDCNVPSGESFVRQALYGRKYFQKYFGQTPTTAINFDSFGHNRGLVQILKKCGYDSYMFCRPMPEMLALDDMYFYWEGYDGSRIKACRIEDDSIYCSGLGTAKTDILRKAERWKDKPVGVALWGVGNHGGGASRKDLEDIAQLQKESDYEIVHSTPEAFFAEIEPTAVFKKSLNPCLVSCYSSLSRVKQAHIRLENELYRTEKICALAALNGHRVCDFSVFDDVMRDMLSIEFHDVLSGTCASDGERSSVMKAEHGLKILNDEFLRAFFALTADYTAAGEGEYPVFVFNPCAQEIERVVEVEFLLNTVLVSDEEHYEIRAGVEGKSVPVQVIKELSNINYDRRKRIAVRVKLRPLGVTRIDCTIEKVKNVPMIWEDRYYTYSDEHKSVTIDRKTGCLTSFVCDGVEYLGGESFRPVIYSDNADPWGWGKVSVGEDPQPMELSSCEKGPFAGLRSVEMVEDGEVLTEIECLFEGGASAVRIGYKIYKHVPYIDVNARVLWQEQTKTLKLKIASGNAGRFVGQGAYGREIFEADGSEKIAQRYVAFAEGGKYFTVCNACSNGCSKQGKDLYLTLLNGAAYCAHPIGDRPLVPANRYVPYIEQGEHEFSYRVAVLPENELEREAQMFAQPPYVLSVFPHGEGTAAYPVEISDPAIVMTALREQKKGKYVIRLFNGSDEKKTATLRCGDSERILRFGRYEIKTLLFDGKKFVESKKLVM